MGRGSKNNMGRGFNIPLVGELIFVGKGGQNTIGR